MQNTTVYAPITLEKIAMIVIIIFSTRFRWEGQLESLFLGYLFCKHETAENKSMIRWYMVQGWGPGKGEIMLMKWTAETSDDATDISPSRISRLLSMNEHFLNFFWNWDLFNMNGTRHTISQGCKNQLSLWSLIISIIHSHHRIKWAYLHAFSWSNFDSHHIAKVHWYCSS